MPVNASQLRDAVVSAINGNGFQPSIQAVAAYDLAANIQDLSGGRILVIPQTRTLEPTQRRGDQRASFSIDVGTQFKGKDILPATLDPYLCLSEQIAVFFLGRQINVNNVPTGTCTEVTWPHGLFIQQHMSEFRALTSVVTLKFLVN